MTLSNIHDGEISSIFKKYRHRFAWKVSKYGVISGLYFPVFSSNTGKYGPEITPYLDTFHAVRCLIRSLIRFNYFMKSKCKSMDWFLYDRDLRHERVKCLCEINDCQTSESKTFPQTPAFLRI